MVNIDKLKPCPWNPRKHPDKQINVLVRSLKEYGFDKPVLVTKTNMILTGHGIVQAAKKSGLTKVPVIYSSLVDKRAKARMMMDNKSAALGEDDYSKMADLLVDLDDGQFDLELTGFGTEEVKSLMEWTPTQEASLKIKAGRVVTEEEIRKQEKRLGGKESERFNKYKSDLLDVSCPYCSEVFKISKSGPI